MTLSRWKTSGTWVGEWQDSNIIASLASKWNGGGCRRGEAGRRGEGGREVSIMIGTTLPQNLDNWAPDDTAIHFFGGWGGGKGCMVAKAMLLAQPQVKGPPARRLLSLQWACNTWLDCMGCFNADNQGPNEPLYSLQPALKGESGNGTLYTAVSQEGASKWVEKQSTKTTSNHFPGLKRTGRNESEWTDMVEMEKKSIIPGRWWSKHTK